MKRLLLPLLAALALPTAVNAESYWLILSSMNGYSGGLEKIEVASMEQCEEQGEEWRDGSSRFQRGLDYKCLIGK